MLRAAAARHMPPSTNRDEAVIMEFSLVLILACVTSPLSWTHYYSWMLIPIAFLISRSGLEPDSRGRKILGHTAIILVSLGLYYLTFQHEYLESLYAVVGASYTLAGGLLLLIVTLWKRATLTTSTAGRLPAA
jgi:hypothetical protein